MYIQVKNPEKIIEIAKNSVFPRFPFMHFSASKPSSTVIDLIVSLFLQYFNPSALVSKNTIGQSDKPRRRKNMGG